MFPRPKAFSLLETIVVITILAAALGFSVLYAQTDDLRTDLHTQAALLASYLRESQTDASSGKGGSAYGVHLETDRYVLFEGGSYSANDADNFVVELPAGIQITQINLAGGGSNIVFSTPLGGTTNTGSFDLTSEQITQSVTVTVNSLGSVNYE
jgi:prepilin-type N-terminal cleavage/methylation domain-containing protein